MKNLAKFFVAVAALFVGVSCTTDTTEDLGVQVVGKGQTVITVSTGDGELRTSLGEKADGSYPIFWSENDVLSLNGVASKSIEIKEGGKVATFTWDGTFEPPFCLAYPASDEGTVTFAAEQSYVEGTFSQNAVPMVAYAAESASELTLSYLAGVLQFNVTGNSGVLKSVVIETVDGTPIAGKFDYGFQTGEIKAQAGASSSIDYSFGDGLDLTTGKKSFHVAVPAGAYEAVKVLFIEENGSAMEATLKAGAESAKGAIVPGQVREFQVAYVANKNYFVINDAESLKDFAAEVGAEPALEAIVLKDVDASSIAAVWAPIEGFTGVLRGNGKTISGLTQAFFGTLSGTVSNLTLESTIALGNAASETDTTNNHYGVFAKKAIDATLFSCTAKGGEAQTFQVTNAKYKNVGNARDEMAFGGLVGYAENTTFKGCTNSVLFQVKRPCVDNHSYTTPKNRYPSPSFGGIVGYAKGCTIENCANVAKEFDWYLSGNKDYIYGVNYGGIVGAIEAGADASKPGIVTNCTNSAYLRFRGGTRIASIGGVVGYTTVNVTHCENTAAFTMGSGGFRYCNGFGGVVGYVSGGADLLYLVNRGKITVNIPYTKMVLGGIVGLGDSDSKVACCENYGEIDVQGSRVAVAASYAQMRIGGIAGQFGGTVTQNTNYDTGKITVKAKGVLPRTAAGATNTVPLTCIGGVVGSKSDSGLTENKNYGAITFSPVSDLKPDSNNKDTDLGDISPYIGGVAGFASSIPSSCTNAGKIMVTDSLTCAGLKVGGIIAMCTSASEFANSKNSGDIEVSAVLGKDAYIGGITAWANERADECLNNDNSGNITFSGTASLVYIGGVVGRKDLHATISNEGEDNESRTYSNSTVNNCDNTGKITLTADAKVMGYSIGGVAGSIAAYAENCTNDGAIKILADQQQPVYSADLIYIPVKVGGIAGAGLGKLTNCDNLANGDITIDGDIWPSIDGTKLEDKTLPESVLTGWPASNIEVKGVHTNNGGAIGGILGTCSGANIYSCENNGDITATYKVLSWEGKYTHAYGTMIAGLIGYTGNNMNLDSATKCVNNGNITINSDTTNDPYPTYYSGCISRTGTSTNDYFYNNGKITVTVNTDKLYVGGITGFNNEGAWSNCGNTGDITVNGTITGDLQVGGFSGDKRKNAATSTLKNVTNAGDIVVNATVGGKCNIGGILAMGTPSNASMSNCYNTGNITLGADAAVTGSTTIGGVVARTYYTTSSTAYTLNIDNCATKYIDEENKTKPVITILGSLKGTAYVGGVVGWISGTDGSSLTNLYNNGDIVANAKGDMKSSVVGGVLAYGNAEYTFKNCTNRGNITAENNVQYMGGITGSYVKDNSVANWDSLTNEGDLWMKAAQSEPWVSGILPRVQNTSGTDDENTGVVWKNMHNSGDITIGPGIDRTIYSAGIGTITVALNYCSSTGDICMYGTQSAASAKKTYVGMFNGNTAGAARKVSNSLVKGAIQRNTDATPIEISESNYTSYLFNNSATSGTYENVYTTGEFVPEVTE